MVEGEGGEGAAVVWRSAGGLRLWINRLPRRTSRTRLGISRDRRGLTRGIGMVKTCAWRGGFRD